MLSRSGLIAVITCWVVGVGALAVPAMRHQYTPGVASDAGTWPATSAQRPAADGLTLVLVAHARCPCAWASLDELEQVLTRAPRLHARIVVVTPPGVGADEALARRAARLPGAVVIADDGAEATRFGVSTSGHVLLFDPAGTLRFSGGITPSRGHRGDNAGLEAVIALAHDHVPSVANAPVYGCPLASPADKICTRCVSP